MRCPVLLLISGLLCATAYAQTTRPAEEPAALPPGHPALPEGHPVLPSGHPDISQIAPMTQPASHGGIAVRVVQGTKDAAPIKDEAVVVDLYHQGKIIRKLDGKVDDNGIITFEDLPLLLPFQPVVRMTHGGVEYSVSGDVMDGQHPNQKIDLLVYESTDQPPAWQIHMLHVMATPTAEGLRVMEMLAIQNPGDRTWVGKPDDKGRRVTLSMALPPGAQNVVVSGLLQDGSVLTDEGRLISTQPLQPGFAEGQITYLIPGKDGQANLKVTTPAPVSNMILFVPDDGSPVKVEGLESAGVRESGARKSRMFRGSGLKAGQDVLVNVVLPQAAAPLSAAASVAPKVIAGVGAALILVVGAFVVILKTPQAKKRP